MAEAIASPVARLHPLLDPGLARFTSLSMDDRVYFLCGKT
jgi:hypothetical protein